MSNPNQVVVSQVNDVTTVEITTAGPQGETGATGATGPQGPSVSDGDKGDITISNSGGTFTIDAGVVSTAKIADDAVTADKLANTAVTAGSYTNADITVDAQGRVTSASDGSASGGAVTGVSGTAPITSSGGTTPAIGISAATTSAAGSMSASDKSKLDGIEASATADQTNAEIKTAYEANSDTNAFTDADHSKLDGIEASADVTDATNVDAAGAVMNSDSTTASMSFVVDEDNMSSDSATKVPTQQSVKAYVDTEVTNMVTTTGSQTLTNKSIDLDNNTITNIEVDNLKSGVLDTDLNSVSSSDDTLASAKAIKSYVDANSSDTTYTAGTGLSLSGTTFNVDQIALTTVQTAANESAHLALTTQEGDIVVRSDQNKSYVRNSGTAGTMADFTELLTPTDQVLSVNGNTGAITAAQIAAAVEAATDSNVFTDADHSKLNGIEATADVTDATNVDAAGAVMNSDLDGKGELLVGDGSGDPTALAVGTNGYVLKANSSTATGLEWAAAGSGGDTNQNAFSNVAVSGQDTVAADSTTDTLNIAAGSNVTITINASNDTVTIASTDTNTTYSVGDGGLTQNNFTNTLKTKLDGIEASATADQTAAEIRTLVESASDSNVFTDADHTKQNGIEASATADQTAAEIRALVDSASDSNVFTDADHTKLDGIAANANVGITDVVGDTSPQLGGSLDVNGQDIVSTSNGAIELDPNGSGKVTFKGNSTKGSGQFVLNCEQNSHGIVFKGPPHSAAASYTFTLPNDIQNGKYLTTDASGNTSWGTPPDTNTTYSVGDGGLTTNDFTDADHSKLDGIAASANNYSHPNHSGEVTSTGDGATVIADNVVDEANLKVSNSPTDGYFLQAQSGNTGGLTWAAASGGGGLSSDSQGNTVGGTNAGDSFSGTDAVSNTLIGYNAGTAVTTGDSSTCIGYEAGKSIAAGTGNVHVGYQAGESNANNGYTTFVGYRAGRNNTSFWNVAIGGEALMDCTSAAGITAVGAMAATNVTTGNYTTAVGYEACKATKDSYENTGIGFRALKYADNAGGDHTFYGSWNVAVGAYALEDVTVGRQNTAIGKDALKDATTPNNNTAVGYVAMAGNTTGGDNTCVGAEAGQYITTGSENTLIGYRTLFGLSGTYLTGNNNTCLGYKAIPSTGTVSNEVTIGNTDVTKFRIPGIDFILKDNGGTPTEGHVLTVDSNGEAGFAAAAGGGLSSDSQGNTVAGDNAGDSFDGTNAQKNTLYGYNAGTSITTGDFNTAIGYNAFYGNSGSVTGAANIGIGYFVAGNLTSGYDNFLAGRFSGLALTEGYYNIAIGRNSFRDATSAAENVCIGFNSGADITSAVNNTILGSDAGNTLTTGGNNIVLGHNAQPSSNTVDNEITLGDSSIASIRCNVQTISSLSDRRDKTDINILDLGLDFVKSLNPVKFKWETRDGNGKDGSYEAGFIAQDFQQIQKENDADYLGLVMDENPNRLEASYGKLVPILVKAIQELTIEVEKLKSNG